ncbi:M23 family metallopeptidase [Kribbella sandramycini]|uniref:M23 family metallopeptidase n=1 Tax=Kribbella sandramycini TaxID=60450 RepID=A0A7Y4P0Z6_9ACTN|nr:M23 family metallopeptidase [Kribbella sandramycini]MBB6570551.1 hypothetical protein [Kribbella sandramycini]NOL43697.1 M23 family metallopeptidase [Kribbella sandramycini]
MNIFPLLTTALLPVAPAPSPSAAPSATAVQAAVTWPLQPRPAVVHSFELPAKPWLPGHRGLDLAGRPGQPVHAATAGTITYAGPLAGRGVITLTAGRRRTTYEPVVPAVRVGAAVTPGAVLGHLSAAGSHCAPATCLHWGLLEGRTYLNPLTLLPRPPIRLLPLTGRPQQPPGRPMRQVTPASDVPAAVSPASAAPSAHNRRTAAAVVAVSAVLSLAALIAVRRH